MTRSRIVSMGFVALALSVASCGGGAATTTSVAPSGSTTTALPAGSPIAVVVDTDGAIDDLVALTFLLSSDDVDVRAITVSGTGEVRCPAGIGLVRALLARTGDDGVPVACGRSTPLAGTQEFPVDWRDAADSGWGVLVPSAGEEPDYPSAVEALGETVEEGVTVLTLGPLTNLAEAMRADDDLAGRIASIVVMGGAVDVAGNVDPALGAAESEWNVFVDPTAASEVFGSGAPVVLVALDATSQVPVTPLFLERLALNSHTVAAEFVETLYGANPLVGTGNAYFWDPLAAVAVVDSGLLTTERVDIAVVTETGPEAGRTIRSETGFPVELATDADAAAFEDLLLRTLDEVSEEEALVEPPPPIGEAVVEYDGTTCTYDGPSQVTAGRMEFTFESDDPNWMAAVAQLTGELTAEEILAWVEANPNSQEAVPGIEEVTVVPPGAVTYVAVRAPGVGVVCQSTILPIEILIAASLDVE